MYTIHTHIRTVGPWKHVTAARLIRPRLASAKSAALGQLAKYAPHADVFVRVVRESRGVRKLSQTYSTVRAI